MKITWLQIECCWPVVISTKCFTSLQCMFPLYFYFMASIAMPRSIILTSPILILTVATIIAQSNPQ